MAQIAIEGDLNRDPGRAVAGQSAMGLAPFLTREDLHEDPSHSRCDRSGDSLGRSFTPMSFINLGSSGAIPAAVIADRLAELTPNGTYAHVDGAVHLSFLPECKEGAAELLKSSGEIDPVCEDGGNRSRADLHAELNRLVLDAFQRTLKDPRQN